MQSILVATDFSANAASAVRYAAALAARIHTRLVLFNAFQLPLHASNTLLSPSGVDELVAVNSKRLEALALRTAQEFGIAVSATTRYALLTDTLDDVVRDEGAGLVVLGMHEIAWADEYFGNTTTAVIRAATYPVLVVPEGAEYAPQGIERILFAFDDNCLSSRNSLHLLTEMARSFGARVQVFHVAGSEEKMAPDDRPNQKVEAALQHVVHQYKTVMQENIVAGIIKEVAAYGAQLVAVVPGKTNFWKRVLHQSTTRALALKIEIPLLVLPNDAAQLYN